MAVGGGFVGVRVGVGGWVVGVRVGVAGTLVEVGVRVAVEPGVDVGPPLLRNAMCSLAAVAALDS